MAIMHTTIFTDEEMERGREKLRRAHAWRAKNPRAWRYVIRCALNAAKNGRRVGGQELVEAVRAHEFTDEDGRPTTTNNDYAPIFARWLVAQFPQLDPLIERRVSVFDVLMRPLFEKGADHDEQ